MSKLLDEKPIVIKKGCHLFDRNVQKMGFCCTLSYIRMHVKDTDTVKKLAERAGVSEATIKNHRKALREGRLKCEFRDTCLRALWMTPGEMRNHDKTKDEVAEGTKQIGAVASIAAKASRKRQKE